MKNIFFGSFLVLLLTACWNRPSKKVEPEVLDSGLLKQDSLVFQNDTIAIFQLDSVVFFAEMRKQHQVQDTLVYIEDLELVKKQLKGIVTFGGYNDSLRRIDSLTPGEMLAKVKFRNGDSVLSGRQEDFDWIGFVRYYPSEDILLLEGGHSSDYSIHLKTGEMGPTHVGNPAYITYSESKQFRLNGWFPGQECSSYFIQRKIGEEYKHYAEVPMHLSDEGFDLCTIKDVFWDADSVIYFRNTYYEIDHDDRLGFFKLVLK